MFAVPGGGIGKVDVHKVRKIRFAQPFAFTKVRDGFLRIVYLGLTGVAFGLLFRLPIFIPLLVVFIRYWLLWTSRCKRRATSFHGSKRK